MKSIATLAAEEAPAKRRKRGGDEDTFGANDADWGIYREISKDDDSDDEESESTALAKLDDLLITHDPTFVPEDIYDETAALRHTIMYRLAHGSSAADPNEDPRVANQIHLNVERIRVPEVMFQPSIVGLDQAGIVETFGDILKRFGEAERGRMVQNVFITGGNTLYPNFSNRIEKEIRSIRPFGSPLRIYTASDSRIDAWRGASQWAATDAFKTSLITRAMYEEYGHDYVVEHAFGNRWWQNGM
ncbi:Nuclear actin-protein involved in chromatin remodeling [Borealophlyctis nickersoniae]|nr:Nuclear actin-protein involved in chromatin remodeling [Borealophlyctis nickersoniae]